MRLLLEILGGGVPPDSPIPEPYQDAIFHTHIYTWPLDQRIHDRGVAGG